MVVESLRRLCLALLREKIYRQGIYGENDCCTQRKDVLHMPAHSLFTKAAIHFSKMLSFFCQVGGENEMTLLHVTSSMWPSRLPAHFFSLFVLFTKTQTTNQPTAQPCQDWSTRSPSTSRGHSISSTRTTSSPDKSSRSHATTSRPTDSSKVNWNWHTHTINNQLQHSNHCATYACLRSLFSFMVSLY